MIRSHRFEIPKNFHYIMSYEAIKYLRKEGKKVSVLRTVRAIGRLSELGARRVKVSEEEIERERAMGVCVVDAPPHTLPLFVR